MEFRTLENTSIAEITTAFNEAFNDYFIRLQLTEQTMAAKMRSENILLHYSVGAFEQNRLVGFILHGYDLVDNIKTIYNGGTGVIPAFRGKGITAALYQHIIPVLQKDGIHTHLLEVIDNNFPAIKIYEEAGFKIIRKLAAFKSDSQIENIKDIAVTEINTIDEEAKRFISIKPAWQNSLASIERDKENHAFLGVYKQNKLVAYAVYAPASGRVRQCAVHPDHRRIGIGTALFQHMQHNSGTGELLVTNIDTSYQPALSFFDALKFKKILGIYEMKMEVH